MTRFDDLPAGRRSPSRRGGDSLEQGLDRLVSAGRQLVDGVSGARPGGSSRRGTGLPRLDGLGRWVEDKLDWILEEDDDWSEPWQEPAPPRGTASRGDGPRGDASRGDGSRSDGSRSWDRPRRAARRPLEAISRRARAARAPGGTGPIPAADQALERGGNRAAPGVAAAGTAPAGFAPAGSAAGTRAGDLAGTPVGDPDLWSPDDWPDDDLFSVPRWQRSAPSRSPLAPPAAPAAPERAVPPAGGRPLPRSSRRPGR